MSWVDSIIGIFSPRLEAQRRAWRARSAVAEEVKQRAQFYGRQALARHRGADTNRGRGNWVPGAGSADYDMLDDLPTLRERSRDMNRNNSYASGATLTMQSNVVGRGLRPQSRIDREALGMTEDQAIQFKHDAERVWREWSESPFCDATNRCNFAEMQALIERAMLESGDVFVLPLMLDTTDAPPRPYSLALEIVEADRVNTPSDKASNKSIRTGVEIGSRGEPVAYWVQGEHPADPSRYRTKHNNSSQGFSRVKAWGKTGRPNVMHCYHVLRPGQTRGLPFFAPIMSMMKNLAEGEEAEVFARRMEACIGIITEAIDPVTAATALGTDTDSDSKLQQSFEPGMHMIVPPGHKVTPFNPTRPGANFEAFEKVMLRSIATGLGLPYELVAKNYSEVNYSSMRASLLQTYRYFRTRQQVLITHVCQPSYEMAMEEAWLRGRLRAPDFYAKRWDYCRTIWIPDGWEWVDPVKEAKAAVVAVKAGFSTLADECAKHGKDWEDVTEQQSVEKAAREARGLAYVDAIDETDDEPAGEQEEEPAKKPAPVGAPGGD